MISFETSIASSEQLQYATTQGKENYSSRLMPPRPLNFLVSFYNLHKKKSDFSFREVWSLIKYLLRSSQQQLPDNHKPLCCLPRAGGKYFRIYSTARKRNKTENTVIVDSTISGQKASCLSFYYILNFIE